MADPALCGPKSGLQSEYFWKRRNQRIGAEGNFSPHRPMPMIICSNFRCAPAAQLCWSVPANAPAAALLACQGRPNQSLDIFIGVDRRDLHGRMRSPKHAKGFVCKGPADLGNSFEVQDDLCCAGSIMTGFEPVPPGRRRASVLTGAPVTARNSCRTRRTQSPADY
jgi:hypothetical protein